MAKARRRENAGGPWYRDRFSGLAQTRKVEVVDASVTDFATELALVVIAAAAPATAIAVADDQPALDLVAVALAVDARHLRDVGAAVAARAPPGGGDAPAHRAAAVPTAAINIAISISRVSIAVGRSAQRRVGTEWVRT